MGGCWRSPGSVRDEQLAMQEQWPSDASAGESLPVVNVCQGSRVQGGTASDGEGRVNLGSLAAGA